MGGAASGRVDEQRGSTAAGRDPRRADAEVPASVAGRWSGVSLPVDWGGARWTVGEDVAHRHQGHGRRAAQPACNSVIDALEAPHL